MSFGEISLRPGAGPPPAYFCILLFRCFVSLTQKKTERHRRGGGGMEPSAPRAFALQFSIKNSATNFGQLARPRRNDFTCRLPHASAFRSLGSQAAVSARPSTRPGQSTPWSSRSLSSRVSRFVPPISPVVVFLVAFLGHTISSPQNGWPMLVQPFVGEDREDS